MNPGGVWYNELGSNMVLEVSGSSVWGTYYSAVGNSAKRYELVGRIDTQPAPAGQALGWAVAWVNSSGNSHSATSWSGQYQIVDGIEEIVALWLLTYETPPDQDWASTLVGKDVFTRYQPTPEQIEHARRRSMASHPRDA